MTPPDPADFDYCLPQGLIAQEPLPDRAASRLLVLDPVTGSVAHARFRDLPTYLRPGDVIVLNDTRVLPARLLLRRGTGGAAEALLLHPLAGGDVAAPGREEPAAAAVAGDVEPVHAPHAGAARGATEGAGAGGGDPAWTALVRPARRLRAGEELAVLDHDGRPAPGAALTHVRGLGGGQALVRLRGGQVGELLVRYGRVPLPPYIRRPLAEPGRYQTVYAEREGSAAAPTAGLHFTPALLSAAIAAGAAVARVTLHVGLGTFLPPRAEDLAAGRLHAEWCELRPETAALVNGARRVVAVGTTSVRTLESAAAAAPPGRRVAPYRGWTSLLIAPGHRFHAVDALVTNFHLPKSTLMMLVSAFAGRQRLLAAYAEAVRARYRFFSFGDAMLIAEGAAGEPQAGAAPPT